MAKIWYIPLEDSEQRYTAMMNSLICPLVEEVVWPKRRNPSTNFSAELFLDFKSSSEFKLNQLLTLIDNLNYVENGDSFLLADLWFPGIEAIWTILEMQNKETKWFAFNHAGRADPVDQVQKLGDWSDEVERGWHYNCDAIFVGSEFQRKQIDNKFDCGIKTIVTGMPWSTDYVYSKYPKSTNKKRRVIWPHRLAWEKGIEDFIIIANECPEMEFLVTSGGNDISGLMRDAPNVKFKFNLKKEQYYAEFSQSEFYLSTAHQETFGYTLQEAIAYGCKILVPNRCSYPEMVPQANLYRTVSEACLMLKAQSFGSVEPEYTLRHNDNVSKIINFIRTF